MYQSMNMIGESSIFNCESGLVLKVENQYQTRRRRRRCSREDQHRQGGLLEQMAQILTTAWLLTLVSFIIYNLKAPIPLPFSSSFLSLSLQPNRSICFQSLLCWIFCIIDLVSSNFRVSKSSWREISSLRAYSHSGKHTYGMFWYCNVYQALLLPNRFQLFSCVN